MIRPTRGQTLSAAPIEDLLTLLLRQFKRPLAAQDVQLSDADIQVLTREIVQAQPASSLRAAVRTALATLIAESEQVLGRWQLSFEQALATPMDQIAGWETTAEFLEIANEKANAELRISAGAALLAALGDMRHAARLIFLIERDPDDTDAQIGQRLLSWAAGIAPDGDDWPSRARAWLDKAPSSDVH